MALTLSAGRHATRAMDQALSEASRISAAVPQRRPLQAPGSPGPRKRSRSAVFSTLP